MKNSSFLKPGDVIDIIAPSAKCPEEVLIPVKQLVQSWELECHIPDNLFGDSLLYANSDERRFEHLKNALLNTKSKAIWCLLGGFGATRLIPMLARLIPPNHSKFFIGFSDTTAIHIFLQNQWNWQTIHAPSALQAIRNKVSLDCIEKLKTFLFDPNSSFSYKQVTPLNALAENHDRIESQIIGGNLHLIQASLGTSWQMNTDNKIIFIEDISERAYRVDRALVQMDQAGIFKKARAILFGDFVDCVEPDGRCLIDETLQLFAKSCSIPVLKIKDIGHGIVNNPLVLGSSVTLNMGKKFSLNF